MLAYYAQHSGLPHRLLCCAASYGSQLRGGMPLMLMLLQLLCCAERVCLQLQGLAHCGAAVCFPGQHASTTRGQFAQAAGQVSAVVHVLVVVVAGPLPAAVAHGLAFHASTAAAALALLAASTWPWSMHPRLASAVQALAKAIPSTCTHLSACRSHASAVAGVLLEVEAVEDPAG